MKATISSLLDSLVMYTSLWQGELSGIIVPTPHRGKPQFWPTELGVVVEATQRGRDVWITLLPDIFAYQCEEIALRIPQTHTFEPLTPAQLFPNAMQVYESDGRTHSCCVMIQDRFLPIDDFIRRNISNRERQFLRNALHSIALNINSFCDGHLKHGAISSSNVGFDNNGALRIADYPIGELKAERNDLKALTQCAIHLFIAACSKEVHALFTSDQLRHIPFEKRVEYIVSAAQHHGVDSLATAALLCVGTHDVESYRSTIKALASEPFRPLPLLYNLLAQYAKLPTDNPTIATEEEVTPNRIDFNTCDFVAPPSDTYIRYHKGDSWGYANYCGDIINIGKRLIYATDFYESLAVVRTERGYGVINTAGEWVMEDRWADIVWHGEENIITATEDGTIWHIYNRRGHQISYYGCHGFGTPSEGYIVARWKEKFGYYTTEGEKVVDFIYEQAGMFHKGFALVRYNGRTYHIDTTFHRIGSVQEQLLAEGKI